MPVAVWSPPGQSSEKMHCRHRIRRPRVVEQTAPLNHALLGSAPC